MWFKESSLQGGINLKRPRRTKVVMCELFFKNLTRCRSYRHTGRACRAAFSLTFHVSVHVNRFERSHTASAALHHLENQSLTFFDLDMSTVLRKNRPDHNL